MKSKLLIMGVVTLSIVSIVMSVYAFNGQEKIAHFDYNAIYNDCDLKKELESDLEKVVSHRKSELDSLQMELSFLSERINTGGTDQEELNHFEDMKNRFLMLQSRYEEENIRLKESYFKQIRDNIDKRVKEFAADEGYDYLLSRAGESAVAHGKEDADITDDLMEYVNK
jgi:Skp family chaperone for outer membrane proteins